MYNSAQAFILNRVPTKKWVQFDSKEVLLVDGLGEADELIGEESSV